MSMIDTNHLTVDDEQDEFLPLLHDPLGWQDLGQTTQMDKVGNLFEMAQTRVNGPFFVGIPLEEGVPMDAELPYQAIHWRTGIILGRWSMSAIAEAYADTLRPLHDWEQHPLPPIEPDLVALMPQLNSLLLEVFNQGAEPIDPRFSDIEYIH